MNNTLKYLIENADNIPSKKAFADEKISFTYGELISNIRLLGAYIKDMQSNFENCCLKLVPSDIQNINSKPIGVIADHSCMTLLAFLSIAASGNFYVPIDPKNPVTKTEKILNDSKMDIVFGSSDNFSAIPETFKGKLLDTKEILASLNDTSPNEVLSIEDLESVSANQPLYMIYTSGSTGFPKGVLKSHSAVVDFVEAYTETFDFSHDEIIASQTPFFFDASAKDIYLTLKLGCTLEIIPEGMFTLPPNLIRYINEKKVTFASWVPSALSVITQLNTFDVVVPETLKKVFFVGESFPIKQFKKWQERLPEIEYVNLYGATELSGICCYYKVPLDIGDADRLPIGKALKNCEVYLVDTDTKEKITEPGKTGEIYLVSNALSLGYYNDSEKTSASFVMLDGKRTFKTGDLAWYDENMNLNFASRNDSQIKHMGQRIELGEIETICLGLDEIRKACCLYDENKKRIYLFCELNDGYEEDQKSLLIKLKEKLVSYMRPQRVVIKGRLPLNSNGKIDRQLLKQEM